MWNTIQTLKNKFFYITACLMIMRVYNRAYAQCIIRISYEEFYPFYNEELEYYVTEEWDQEINVSDRYRLKVEDMNSSKEDSKYKRINNMINKLDMQDEQGLLNMMADYIEREYIISKCYDPYLNEWA